MRIVQVPRRPSEVDLLSDLGEARGPLHESWPYGSAWTILIVRLAFTLCARTDPRFVRTTLQEIGILRSYGAATRSKWSPGVADKAVSRDNDPVGHALSVDGQTKEQRCACRPVSKGQTIFAVSAT